MVTEKKRSLSPGFIIILIILAFFLLFMAIAVPIVAMVINSAPSGKDEAPPFTVYLKRGSEVNRRLKAEEIIFDDGQAFISPEVFSDYCSYGIYGDGQTRTLVFPDGSYAKFFEDSAFELDGEKRFLSESCKMVGEKIYIPLEFYEQNIEGMLVERRQDDNSKNYVDIKVNVDDYSLRTADNTNDSAIPVSDYYDVLYRSSGVSEGFKTDLSAYEEYMNPSDRDRFLFLVNSENTLDKDFLPSQLTDLKHTRRDGRNTQQMDLYAAKAMEAMLTEAAANGYTTLSITSGYRSYNYQQQLFNNQVAALRPGYGDAAYEKAAQAVAIPGTSEHQSGLCCDLHNLPAASQSFANTKEYSWLLQNCAKFGFILRYPKDKTEITGIMFEPWHYRYVGRYHAQRIMGEGLCLEEYVQQLQ